MEQRVMCAMLRFYGRLAQMPDSRLAGFIFRKRCQEVDDGAGLHSWCQKAKAQLERFGLGGIWSRLGRTVPDDWRRSLKSVVHGVLEAEADKEVKQMSSLDVFRRVGPAKFDGWLDYAARHPGAWLRLKLRCGGAPLMVSAGASRGIPREQRTCKMCRTGQVETAEHFVSNCPFYQEERHHCLQKVRELVGRGAPQAMMNAIATAEMGLFLGDVFLRQLPTDIARRVDAAVCDYLKVAWRKRRDVWRGFCVAGDEWRFRRELRCE
jgi:hypothetical protein